MMRTNALTTPNTPVLLPSNKNPHCLPPSKFLHQKPSRNCTSPQTDKTVTLPPHPAESIKGDPRGRNQNGKDSMTMLTKAWSENSRKWTRNMTKNSEISPLLLTIRNSTIKNPMIISTENQATLKILNGISKSSRGVMLQFPLDCIPLVFAFTHPSYLFRLP